MKARWTLGAAVAGALFATSGAWPLAQQPADGQVAVFRADTELIQVDVSVLDKRRRPVKGLTAADFTILEDGQPRPVQAFTQVDLSAPKPTGDAAWMSEVPSDVVTNHAIGQEGRLVVILMDRTIPVGMPTLTARRKRIWLACDELAMSGRRAK